MITDTLTAWIPRVQGKYIDMDTAYGAQCWDLAAHWCAYLGLPVINTGGAGRWPGWAGNMVDAFPQTPEIDAAYDLISPDQFGEPGDIVVWGAMPGLYPSTHVAVLVKDNRNGWLLTMSQNSTLSQAGNPYPEWSTGPTTLQTLPRRGLLGFIRPAVGGISPQGTITPTQEDADMALEETDRQKFYEFLDGYFKYQKPFPGERSFIENEKRVADDLGSIISKIEKLPQAILIDTRVDNRNIFDWNKYNAALEIANAAGATGVEVDVDALAEALAARLPQANAEALVTALAERLAKK